MEKKYHDFVAIITNLRLQHYETDEVGPLAADIETSGYPIIEKLATIAELTEEAQLPVGMEFKERRKSSAINREVK